MVWFLRTFSDTLTGTFPHSFPPSVHLPPYSLTRVLSLLPVPPIRSLARCYSSLQIWFFLKPVTLDIFLLSAWGVFIGIVVPSWHGSKFTAQPRAMLELCFPGTAPRSVSPHHLLFLYSPWAENSSHIFKWLGKKIKRLIFHNIRITPCHTRKLKRHEIQVLVPINKVALERGQAHSFACYLWLLSGNNSKVESLVSGYVPHKSLNSWLAGLSEEMLDHSCHGV